MFSNTNQRWYHIHTSHIALDYAKPGVVFPIEVYNKKAYLTKGEDGSWYAFEKNCPHQGADLEHSKIDGDNVVCPLHQYCFDLKTGKSLNHKGSPLKIYPLKWEEGQLYGLK